VAEVAMSVLLLATIALACGSYVYRSRGDIADGRHRRVALDLANARLEEIRASPYGAVKPAALDYAIRHLSRSGTNWVQSMSDPGETVRINNRAIALSTELQYVDLAPADGSNAYDLVRLRVTSLPRRNGTDSVTLETLMSPW
jgi:hypothetical protein